MDANVAILLWYLSVLLCGCLYRKMLLERRWRCHEEANVARWKSIADDWELVAHKFEDQLERFTAGAKFAQKIEQMAVDKLAQAIVAGGGKGMKIVPMGVINFAQSPSEMYQPPPDIVPDEPRELRGFVDWKCGEHHFLVRFTKETAPQALLQVQRWHDHPELQMCREGALVCQERIIAIERAMQQEAASE